MDLFTICDDHNGADYNGNLFGGIPTPPFSFSIHFNDFVLHTVRQRSGHTYFLMAWMSLPEGPDYEVTMRSTGVICNI